MFVVLTLETVAEYTRSVTAIAVAQLTGALVILVYGVVAQRRVYGGSWLATTAKGFGVATILTTVAEKTFSGPMFAEIAEGFPGETMSDRTSMNTW